MRSSSRQPQRAARPRTFPSPAAGGRLSGTRLAGLAPAHRGWAAPRLRGPAHACVTRCPSHVRPSVAPRLRYGRCSPSAPAPSSRDARPVLRPDRPRSGGSECDSTDGAASMSRRASRGLQDAMNRVDVAVEVGALCRQIFPAERRQRVIPRATVVLGRGPFGIDVPIQ